MIAAPVFLIVEPSSILHSSIREWLEIELTGYHIIIAATGKDALHLTMQEQPSYVLIEMFLPDLPGIEVLQQMRKNLPVAMIIATHWYESRIFAQRALSAGADVFIPKQRLHDELLLQLK